MDASMSVYRTAADVAPTTIRGAGSHQPSGRFDIIRDMLERMDTFTQEGQRYSMRKIVEFIEGQLRQPLHSGQRNQEALAELASGLRRESERPSPNSVSFSHRAKSIVALLEEISHPR